MAFNNLSTYFGLFLLVAVHSLPWFFSRGVGIARSPSKLAAIISAGQIIPQYIVVMIEPDRSAMYGLLGHGLSDLLPKLGLYYSLGYLFFYAGINWGLKYKIKYKKMDKRKSSEPNYYLVVIFAFLCYIISMALIIDKSGGFSHFINNLSINSEESSGTGLYYIIKVPAAYLSILFLLVQNKKTGKPHFIFFLLYLTIVILIESTLGGRRTPMQFVFFTIITMMMLEKDARIISAKNIFLGSLALTAFVGLLILRDSAAGNAAHDTVGRDAVSYLMNFSYNDIYLFVIHHFSTHDLWYGKVFLDFQYRIISMPTSLPPPSLDEGIYIYNLYLGRDVAPPMALIQMAHNSWPPRTFGNGFMNFGLIGVVIFFFIQGVMTGAAYKFVESRNFQPVSLFVYLMIVFSFQISNLKFSELAIIVLGLAALIVPIRLLDRSGSKRAKLATRRE